jgi:hypothetical protein
MGKQLPGSHYWSYVLLLLTSSKDYKTLPTVLQRVFPECTLKEALVENICGIFCTGKKLIAISVALISRMHLQNSTYGKKVREH